MSIFYINNIRWGVEIVDPDNPKLIDRTNTQRVATTDPITYCIYLSDELEGEFLETVLRHELGHAIIFSYGLLYEVHRMVIPEYWVEMEEWICNFLANYSPFVLNLSYDILYR